MFEDWDLIESSFATQYGIRLAELPNGDDMQYSEFCRLLTNISSETPLGNIVNIRREENTDILKSFTPEQKAIRDAWRNRTVKVEVTDEEKAAVTAEVQKLLAQMFG